MDNLNYTYLNIAGAPSNRLGHVDDLVNSVTFTDDIDDQDPNNYSYDQLGQLIGDQQELIANIEWRSGDKKIKALTRTTTAGNKSDMEFVYNPLGQRVVKIEKTRLNNVLESNDKWKYTYYAYDANGQVMATYAVKLSTTVNRATLTEQHLYGASRLGMRRIDKRLYENGTSPNVIPAVQQNTLGSIAYEITNYLGNVNVVISDRKIWNATPTNAFKAVILSKTDYFPFGMEISSRTTSTQEYRYGYNGMESDDETKGSGNSYTTEFRQYDSRLGRWLSLDPLMAQYPMMSPYVAFNNNPIYFVDPLGLEGDPIDDNPWIYYNSNGAKGNLLVLIYNPLIYDELTNTRDFAFEMYRNIVENQLMLGTNFDVILTSSIDIANNHIQEYMKKLGISELNNLVYNDHGNGESVRMKLSSFTNPELPLSEPEAPVTFINAEHINDCGSASDYAHRFAAKEFIKMVSTVKSNGNFVFLGCQIGYNEYFGRAVMEQSSVKNINLYLNGDNSKLKYTPNHLGPFEGKLSGISLTEDFEFGWKKFNKSIYPTNGGVSITIKKIDKIGITSNGNVIESDFDPDCPNE